MTGPVIDSDSTLDLFALLCERRGWSDAYLEQIENPAHELLMDCLELADELERARRDGRRITIAPDFDMDGISSGVLGYAGLKELGFNVTLHLPDYRRGHDVTVEDIDEINQRWPDTYAVLTCDGGVNSNAGVCRARDLGWRTWVTDHHVELLPGSIADLVVNPSRLDETYANKGICGAHVLYQVLETYAARYQQFKLPSIRLLKLFVGLGTVGDVMPVLYENRQLIRDSLSLARLLWTTPPEDLDDLRSIVAVPEAIDIERH